MLGGSAPERTRGEYPLALIHGQKVVRASRWPVLHSGVFHRDIYRYTVFARASRL
jgi:hypothetical protein